jgi:hypothetical protein
MGLLAKTQGKCVLILSIATITRPLIRITKVSSNILFPLDLFADEIRPWPDFDQVVQVDRKSIWTQAVFCEEGTHVSQSRCCALIAMLVEHCCALSNRCRGAPQLQILLESRGIGLHRTMPF